ncbi:MAG: asparagine--tRNA ligase [Treponema sp.]|nr:asparagine--tRNA ligase [Treponema sp.]
MVPLIKDLLTMAASDSPEVTVRGWVRSVRNMATVCFVTVNDGSSLEGIQCTTDTQQSELKTGSSVVIRGRLIPSLASGQTVEVQIEELTVIGEAPPDYPLQKKRHSFEFLREIAHLRARTNTFGALTRISNRLSFAVHEFFQKNGFQHIHTPIITTSDTEGAGALFQVTTLDMERRPFVPDYSQDFFGKKTFLTVSGQLEAESYATALSRVYTFGPTFRAEHSNTTRHLAEFWMIEPEVAFADLNDNAALAEDFLHYLFATILRDCESDLAFFEKNIEKAILATVQQVADSSFSRISYTDAVKELEKQNHFTFKPFWGCDLQTEHERFLTEQVAQGPVIVTDYPKDIKAFYMKLNDDQKTVRAMDVLVPRLGEIIGGAQREDNVERLERRIRESGLNRGSYAWYVDLRRFGTVPHSGFGVGFERLVQYITGMQNIRDVIPYPRAAGYANF